MNITKLGTQFQAVYMDPPLLLPGEAPSPGKITIDQLKTLRIPSVVPKGFLFVWLEKEHLPAIVRMADAWGFKYVENFCWIQKRVNNGIAKREYRYFNKSKLSCLIFRKVSDIFLVRSTFLERHGDRGDYVEVMISEGDVELRHQRNPDCVFDYVKPRREGQYSAVSTIYTIQAMDIYVMLVLILILELGDLTEDKPRFVYDVIETMLPQAVYSAENPNGEKMLEL
ncbi:hypothetical protein BC938DRAFT_475113 [Jimgerdemannia flammicorona]|uniref:MT-A70-domain-containing protein n=1 Tax=Jimgerdemannia flammicorona TaxID=994334 RepID=A0A433Q0Q9_9FUNG|nr:hypothetical protein BC938DRAFT_475113 [Jimgerdemannia flammicorona]